MMLKTYIGKEAQLRNLRDGIVDYLNVFKDYNNDNCMQKIANVLKSDTVEGIIQFPSLSLSIPQINFGDSIGTGEDIEGAHVVLIYPINLHIISIDSVESITDELELIDNFLNYLLNHPNLYTSWVFNGFLNVIPDQFFEKSASFGITFLVGLRGIYHI